MWVSCLKWQRWSKCQGRPYPPRLCSCDREQRWARSRGSGLWRDSRRCERKRTKQGGQDGWPIVKKQDFSRKIWYNNLLIRTWFLSIHGLKGSDNYMLDKVQWFCPRTKIYFQISFVIFFQVEVTRFEHTTIGTTSSSLEKYVTPYH